MFEYRNLLIVHYIDRGHPYRHKWLPLSNPQSKPHVSNIRLIARESINSAIKNENCYWSCKSMNMAQSTFEWTWNQQMSVGPKSASLRHVKSWMNSDMQLVKLILPNCTIVNEDHTSPKLKKVLGYISFEFVPANFDLFDDESSSHAEEEKVALSRSLDTSPRLTIGSGFGLSLSPVAQFHLPYSYLERTA